MKPDKSTAQLVVSTIGGLSYPTAIGLILAGVPWGGLVFFTVLPCFVALVALETLSPSR